MDSDNSDIYLGAAHYPADQFKHLHMVSGFKKRKARGILFQKNLHVHIITLFWEKKFKDLWTPPNQSVGLYELEALHEKKSELIKCLNKTSKEAVIQELW